MAGESDKDAALAALQAKARADIGDEELIVRRFKAELARARAAGAVAAELYEALAGAGYRLDRQRFDGALAAIATHEPPQEDPQAPPADPPDPVSGYAPGYDSGQF